MGFGSTYYGAGGFGSGASIIVPPGTPGPLFSISVANSTQLLLTFVNDYVINDTLLDPTNYLITSSGPASNNIIAVLVEAGNDRASANSVLLTVQKMTPRVDYTISVQNIIDVDGVIVDTLSTLEWPFRITKVQNMMTKLPGHFDLEPESTMLGVIMAIGMIDDQIGGNG